MHDKKEETLEQLPYIKLNGRAMNPVRSHDTDGGLDLASTHDVHLTPGQRAIVGTGLAFEIPAGYAGFVHTRSGIAKRHGIGIVNGPGLVDAGYRGEVMVNLINLDPYDAVFLPAGTRIAQFVVQRVELPAPVEVQFLTPSPRGTGGHGSTGIIELPGQLSIDDVEGAP